MTIYNEFMIGLVVGGGIGFLSSLAAYTFRTRGLKKESRILLRSAFLREARTVLDMAQQETGIVNAVLLHVHNSGGDIHANDFLYSSVIEESPENRSVSMLDSWQRVPLDRQYEEIIEGLHRGKYVAVDIQDMEDGRLKRAYFHKSIRGSIIFRVYDKLDKSFMHVSFDCKKDPNDVIWSKNYAILLVAKDRLTALCEKYHVKKVLQ